MVCLRNGTFLSAYHRRKRALVTKLSNVYNIFHINLLFYWSVNLVFILIKLLSVFGSYNSGLIMITVFCVFSSQNRFMLNYTRKLSTANKKCDIFLLTLLQWATSLDFTPANY